VRESGTLVLRSSNVKNGEIVDADNVYVESEKGTSENVKVGNIIIVVRNGSRALIGKHAEIKENMPNTVIGAFMSGIRSKHSSFVNALLDTSQFEKEIEKNMGATINQITGYMFSKMEFMIPSSAEQERIGNYFKSLDNLITLHQRKCEYLYRLKTSFFNFLYANSTDAWEQRKVGELLIERNEQAPMNEEYPLMAFIANEGVAPKGERYDRSSLVTDTENKLYKRTEFGDFIYSSNNLETGSIGLNKYGKACISPVYSIFHPTGIADSNFLGRRLVRKDFINSMVKWRQGVIYGQWRIHESDFLKIEISVPSVKEQRQIGTFLDYLDNLITLHQRKLRLLKELKNSFMDKFYPIPQPYTKPKRSTNMSFDNELEFEKALINELIENGWKDGILHNPTEKDLINNWAQILFKNNSQKERLNGYPLTDGEMNQIIEQITNLKTPLKINSFINGKSTYIKRDNPNDVEHLGKEISLKIYSRDEIAGGDTTYQIAEQPIFRKKSPILNNRRGDLMLLINGMPVFHIELKKSNISAFQASTQIEKYMYEGIYTGIYSLVQIFIAMNPEETLYFANPGKEGKFNPDFYFHWNDFNNEPINNWKEISKTLLHIPMAHELIGYYTIADNNDEILKVMRSYQYYAANAISNRVSKMDWIAPDTRGGYIWHTTGSGKTMTSFKSAQLVANSKCADKVVFLVDRIELGTQSLDEYRAFADDDEDIQGTENTYKLIEKLKSDKVKDTLIVTSIQKMSRIKDENGLNAHNIDLINKKRLVFIVDECHRGQFGEMHQAIKSTFPKAVFFGFTGTPIQNENRKNMSITSDIFGNELHRYTIADGIRDQNVLGFDIYKVSTFKDKDLRKSVALEKSRAKDIQEALSNPQKKEIFNEFMNNRPMASIEDENGNIIKGIEDYIPLEQYRTPQHRQAVVNNIIEEWDILSSGGKFSAIFATSSIPEAIEYYRLFKSSDCKIKATVLVDPNIDNKKGFEFKEDGLTEIYQDYNDMFNQRFSLSESAVFKKDITLRLAHKKPYSHIGKEEQIDLLIVVDQMLTGYDSKWINTLYLDKVLYYENIIQAFSRTNRLFLIKGEKSHGTIKYYRKPHTMEENIKKAIKMYSGDRPYDLFVPKLKENIESMEYYYKQIVDLFENEGIKDFETIPENKPERKKFVSLFNKFNKYLAAARIQGFRFNDDEHNLSILKKAESEDVIIKEDKTKADSIFSDINTLFISEEEYEALKQRYREISKSAENEHNNAPYEIQSYITEFDSVKVNNDYMNSKFQKYLKALGQKNISKKELDDTLKALHKSFSTLTHEQQVFAKLFMNDINSGDVEIEEGKSFMDYITEYQQKAENDQIGKLCDTFGLDKQKLKKIMNLQQDNDKITDVGGFEKIKNSIDIEKAKNYFEKLTGKEYDIFDVNIDAYDLLFKFIISGGFEI